MESPWGESVNDQGYASKSDFSYEVYRKSPDAQGHRDRDQQAVLALGTLRSSIPVIPQNTSSLQQTDATHQEPDKFQIEQNLNQRSKIRDVNNAVLMGHCFGGTAVLEQTRSGCTRRRIQQDA